MDRSRQTELEPEPGPSLTTIDCTTLVQRLSNPQDEAAWELVVERYGPAVQGFARKLGLDADQAEDACQATMQGLLAALRAGRFDRRRGRLRDLLFGIARHRILDILGALAKQPLQVAATTRGTSFFHSIPSPDDMGRAWAEEWHVAVYRQCLVEAKAHFSNDAYTMFYLRIVEDRTSAEVAELVGKTSNAVDINTHRVREYLRQIRPQIEEIF